MFQPYDSLISEKCKLALTKLYTNVSRSFIYNSPKLETIQASLVAQLVTNQPRMQEIQVQSLGREDPWEVNGNPLQYFYWGNHMDRGAWCI